MVKLIKADFDGHVMQFNDAGWMNATSAAKELGKDLSHWVRSPETIEYVQELNSAHFAEYIETRQGRNGGTWIHPDLIVLFARWCSVKFAIWCDQFVKASISGRSADADKILARKEAAIGAKVMFSILQVSRADEGKETASHHYANEAKLVNFALTGEFKPIIRDELSANDLSLLSSLENRNSVLLGRGVDRETRKEILVSMAADSRINISSISLGVE